MPSRSNPPATPCNSEQTAKGEQKANRDTHRFRNRLNFFTTLDIHFSNRDCIQVIFSGLGYRAASVTRTWEGNRIRMATGACAAAVWLLSAFPLAGQSRTGELRVTVQDPSGLGVKSVVALVSQANHYRQKLYTDDDGYLIAKRLSFGIYRVEVQREGFANFTKLVEVRSVVPLEFRVTLSVAPLNTSVRVNENETLIDPHRTGAANHIGEETLDHRVISPPGRSVIELVNSQPGWLVEANGVLHPRGSEYQTQFVVDGIPLTDNRSPAFAPELDADDVSSMTILTANFPAEYGRKLGGVVEVNTERDNRPGLHGKAVISGGSFGTADGYFMSQYGWGKNTLGVSASGSLTDRYLDPPVLENFTNTATTGNFSARYERDMTDRDRIGFIIRHEQVRFQVPNEHAQEGAGQRQDRNNYETQGVASYQHIFSPNVVGTLGGMVRDLSAALNSNLAATPIIAAQDRGFREGYVKGTVAVHHGRHEWKAGFEADFAALREQFSYVITDPLQFGPGTPLNFSFPPQIQPGLGMRHDWEQSAFVQDMIRLGHWTVSAGLRWDHYQLIVNKNAVSPRLGVAWYWPGADTVIHASYDRVFQTPAFENILLASSPTVEALNPSVLRLPVKPSLGNLYEVGVTKGFFGKFKLDVNGYQRGFSNMADDDLLLNTGISFPISFRKGEIYGAEAKIEVPRWRGISGYLSYSYMVGFGYTPVTGGLFLGDDASTTLTNRGRFPVTQDQRNTASGRFRYQITRRAWMAFGGEYGSGLPTEFTGTIPDALAQFGPEIVNRVNFSRGRVRPSLSLDISAGVEIWQKDDLRLQLQADAHNLNNRLNLINFAGLFSGTALAPPRSYALRLEADF
jgi:outer membrane cobalamin receptor